MDQCFPLHSENQGLKMGKSGQKYVPTSPDLWTVKLPLSKPYTCYFQHITTISSITRLVTYQAKLPT